MRNLIAKYLDEFDIDDTTNIYHIALNEWEQNFIENLKIKMEESTEENDYHWSEKQYCKLVSIYAKARNTIQARYFRGR